MIIELYELYQWKESMAYPQTLTNELRLYDQSIYDLMDGLKINYGDISGEPRRNFGILRVFATPRRAVSAMQDVLVRKGWLNPANPGEGSESGEKSLDSWMRIPLPFVSIWRQAPTPDASRFQRGPFRPIGYNADLSKAYSSRYPTPVNIPYSLDFWSVKKFTEAYILEWILSMIGGLGAYHNEFFVTVTPKDHAGATPWGSKIIPLTLESIVDNSELEPSENDRVLRMTVDFLMKAWIFHIPTEVYTTKRIQVITESLEPFGQPDEIILQDRMFDSFNLVDPGMWTLTDAVGDSSYTYEDEKGLLIPGTDPAMHLDSEFVPAETATYEVKGNFKVEGSFIISVLNAAGATLATSSFSASWQETSFRFTFVANVTDVKMAVRLAATSRLLLSDLVMRKV